MALRTLGLVGLLALAALTGCSRDTPQVALERAVTQLQENLEAKATAEVLDQLHPEFSAQQQFDRDWAKRTMTLLFLRHKNVQVIALGEQSRVDPTYKNKGHTKAQVTLAGAEGLIPDSARSYSVQLEWWLEGQEWKLARLNWE